MKKMLLFLFVLFLPFCFGLHNMVIYDDWVLSGEKLNISNQTFKAIYVKDSNSTVVYFPEGISIVLSPGNNTCASEWIYSVCQSVQRFEKNGVEVIPSIHDPNIDVYLKLQINSSNVSLSFFKQINSPLFLGDKILINVIVEKSGGASFYDVTNISYIDYFSKDFDIEIIKGCVQNRYNVLWNKETMSSNHECVYYLTPKKEQNFTNKVELYYDVLGKKQEKSFEYEIEVIEIPFDYEIITNKQLKKIGELNNFTLKIFALSGFTLEKIEFNSFEGFYLLNDVKKDVFLEKGNISEFTYFFNNTRQGNNSLNFVLYYRYGTSKKISDILNFQYIAETFDISLFERNNISIIRLNNPSLDFFSDIKIKVNNSTLLLDFLGPKKFFEFEIETTNQTKLNLSYKTKYLQNIEKNIYLSESEDVFDSTEKIIPVSKKPFNLGISFEYVEIVVGSLVLSFLLYIIISKFKKKETNLDKEIEEIRKKKL